MAANCRNSDNVTFSFSSLYWLSGLATLLVGTFAGNKRIITTEPFSPELLLSIIEKFKVQTVLTSAYQVVLTSKCKKLSSADLSSVQVLACGGAKVPFEVCEQLKQYLPNGIVVIGYAISEIGVGISGSLLLCDGDSLGKLCDGIEMKIIDENGKKCGVGEDGDICVKAQNKVLGYYANETATKEILDDEGFVLTGDIGHFDEKGILYFVDRKKDLLKYRSFQISPAEIENFLIENPQIKAACVVGIQDEESNDLPAAVVVKNENCDITKEEIEQLVAGKRNLLMRVYDKRTYLFLN